MRKFHNLRNQKGMTLVELMLVMVIVAIIAAISIPMWASYMPTMRLNGAAQNLQLALALARMKAVARNRPLALLLSADSYRLQIHDGANWVDDVDPTRGDKLMTPTDLSALGINITWDSVFINNRVIFNPRGSSVNAVTGGALTTGNITLSGHGKSRIININGTTGIAKLN